MTSLDPNLDPLTLALVLSLVLGLVIWSGIWKAIALWRAGRRADLAWFIVMCVVNTVGILEIVYIFAVSRRRPPTS
jgi:predicted Co/Zn/Cd cation transporter (cation efflux family)